MDTFHWIIFALHLTGALTITFGVWFRCDADLWVSEMRVDTYDLPVNSSGLWWYSPHDDNNRTELQASCSALNATQQSRRCFAEDMPLYERAPSDLGWHLFALLGHFEWVSAAFAFFYIEGSWNRHSWKVSVAMSGLGTLLFLPMRGGHVFANEVALLVANFVISASVFYGYRNVHGYQGPSQSTQQQPEPAATLVFVPPEPSQAAQRSGYHVMRIPPHMTGRGNMQTDSLRLAELPAMRFSEYCITASELWVAVLAVFVKDPPAFMSIGGYALILLCNLYGLLLHYSLISKEMTVELKSRVPDQLIMRHKKLAGRRNWVIPRQWTHLNAGAGAGGDAEQPVPAGPAAAEPSEQEKLSAYETIQLHMVERRVWASFIASNISTLLNSWLAYVVAIALIFYQQTFLFSPDPPVFVVFAGWSLLASYTSFGLWITLLYWSPGWVYKCCVWCPGICTPKSLDTLAIAVHGLDILSVGAKLSIVGSLSYGFVFQADGMC
jgi:hypothetical protein